MGIDMIKGGGKLFVGSGGRVVGPGHFSLLDVDDGVQKFSCHYEADLDRGGSSVLDIRPLLWKDGWPVAGENVSKGVYEIESIRTGTALELAVEGVPVGGRSGMMMRRGGGGGMNEVIPPQNAEDVSRNWPAGNIDIRLSNYMLQAQQRWMIEPAANAGGYPGSPYFKITIAGTDRALAVTEEAELVTVPVFTGIPEQLWRIEQLTDGTYRVMPKAIPNSGEELALSAVGASSATLSRFDFKNEKQHWQLNIP
jgi:arabinan endo-1,5-alpha-L-arabinosidase